MSTTCNKIKEETNCKTREDCLWNKSKKCQKRPIINKTKKEQEKLSVSSLSTIPEESESSSLLEESPTEDACKIRDQIAAEIKRLQQEKKVFDKKCNEQSTELTTSTTYLQLLQYLYKNNILEYDQFFMTFQSTAGGMVLIKPHIFEGLWKIVFLLKLDNISLDFERKFKMRMGNQTTITPFKYLKEKINSGSKTGICDLYFQIDRSGINDSELNACEQTTDSPKPDIFLFSSKYKKTESGDFDIPQIDTQARTEGIVGNRQIVILTKNKRAACKKRSCYNNFIHEDFVFGEDELREIYFKKMIRWLHTNFDKTNIDDENRWKDVLKDITGKYPMSLRFHQDYVVKYTQHMLGDKSHGKFIWGAVARSGKTFMAGGLVSLRQPKIVILLLGAVNETKNQFIDDLFQKYSDFKDYDIIDTQRKRVFPSIEPDKKYIIVVSQEKIRSDVKSKSDNILLRFLHDVLKEQDKIIFFDEVHQGGGEGSMQLDTIKYFYQPQYPEPILIMITATYGKPLKKYSSELGRHKTPTILVTWSYEMIQLMKNFVIDMIDIKSDKEPKLIPQNDIDYKEKIMVLQKILGQYDISRLPNEYAKYPELVYLLPQLGSNTFGGKDNVIIDQGKNILKLFEVTEDSFTYKSAIQDYLTFLYDNIYTYLFQNYQYRANGEGETHSQLWFLPTTIRSSSNDDNDNSQFEVISRRLAEEILEHTKFRKFNVCIIHSLSSPSRTSTNSRGQKIFYECIKDKDVKACIKHQELRSKQDNRSLIILTGKRLRLGISLPCVDVAIHMDPIQSYDIMYQSMFRVLTERKGKRRGFFVDMILDRSISFFYDYTKRAIENQPRKDGSRITIEDVRRTLRLFDLNGITHTSTSAGHNYDALMDVFKLNNEDEFDIKVSEFYASVSEKSLSQMLTHIYHQKDAKRELERFIRELNMKPDKSKSNQRTIISTDVLSTNATFVPEPPKPNNTQDETSMDDNSLVVDMATLAKSIRNTLSVFLLFSLDESKTGDEITELQYFLREPDSLDYNAIRMCSDDNIMYYCYLLIDQELDMLSNEDIRNKIRKYLSFIEFVYNYSSESNEDLINLYRDIKENMKTSKLKRKLKQEQLSFSDTSQFCPTSFLENEKVLEIIHKYLTPKESEKQSFGEVFTPVELVCEMLGKLPPDVWKDPLKKWLDPASGIGNYPIIVYYKLMETLVSIPLARRSKYIIEKMLYMVELNDVNAALCKKIFKMIDSEASPNISSSDFLKQTDKWSRDFNGVHTFDVIIGNPPYNSGNTGRSGEKHLDEIFIVRSLEYLKDEHSYLLFITKTGWRTTTSSAYQHIIDKQFIYIKSYDFKNNPFRENVLTCYFLLKNTHRSGPTTFEFLNEITKAVIIPGMSIYFLYKPYMRYLHQLTQTYGNFNDIVRRKKTNGSEYLLVRFSTAEVLVQPSVPSGDTYYVFTDPSPLTKFFFKSNLYKELRELGRFSGFSTAKGLLCDIPNFNNIKEHKNEIHKMLGKYNAPISTGRRIGSFLTKKRRKSTNTASSGGSLRKTYKRIDKK